MSFGDQASSKAAGAYAAALEPKTGPALKRLCGLLAWLVPAFSAQAALTINSVDLPTRIGRGQTVTATVTYVRASGSGPETVTVTAPGLLDIVAPLLPSCVLAGASGSTQTLSCTAIDPGGVSATGSFSLSLALGGGLLAAANAGPPASLAQNSFTVVSGGDLSIAKTIAPASVFINGQSPTFTLTHSLSGDALPAGATISITDQFPGGVGEFTLTSVTASGYTCGSVAAANAARQLDCTITGPLATLVPITLQGRVTAAGAGGLRNNVAIAPDGISYIDTAPGNDTAFVDFTVNNGADPRPTGSFAATAPVSTAQPLTIGYANDGRQSTTGGQVRVAIPLGFTMGALPAGCAASRHGHGQWRQRQPGHLHQRHRHGWRHAKLCAAADHAASGAKRQLRR